MLAILRNRWVNNNTNMNLGFQNYPICIKCRDKENGMEKGVLLPVSRVTDELEEITQGLSKIKQNVQTVIWKCNNPECNFEVK